MRPVPEREAAKAAGEKFYDTGKPCKNGHLAKRSSRSGLCVECEVDRQRRYHAKNPGLEARWARERRAKDPEPHRESSKRWAKNNPENVRKNQKLTFARNPEYWRKKVVAYAENYRTRKMANGGEFTHADISLIHAEQGGKCAGCFKAKRLEVDHVVPVTKGGINAMPNLQLLCRSCNASKHNRDMVEWLHEVFSTYLGNIRSALPQY